MSLTSVKGMRDFYPDDLAIRNWLFEHFHVVARRYNFDEYEPCTVENEELFIRKEGDEITAQLYSFTDKGNRRITLRPELTPSLARMVLARQGSHSYPLRWYTVGQCFRYEKMLKGRKREHFQWNMDIIGEATLFAEIELLSAVVDLFRDLGLTEEDIVIRFSNRKLLAHYLQISGVPSELFGHVSIILDKLEKIGESGVASLLDDIGLNKQLIDFTIAFTNAGDIDEIERLTGDRPAAAEEVEYLLALARDYGVAGYLDFAPSLVRGLSYYTGTVFEGFERSKMGRSIFGGGRYDNLIEAYGGEPTPMVGFGFGDVVILNVLEKRDLIPTLTQSLMILVVAFSESEISPAIKVARDLRQADIPTELDFSFRRLKKTFTRASKLGFSHVVVVAPEELKGDEITIKNLRKGIEWRVAIDDSVRAISEKP